MPHGVLYPETHSNRFQKKKKKETKRAFRNLQSPWPNRADPPEMVIVDGSRQKGHFLFGDQNKSACVD